jgi:dihydroxyacetone kinase
MELAILSRAAVNHLARRGIEVMRAWSGTFLSALDMPGFSLSLLPVDDARLSQLDAPTDAPAWPRSGGRPHLRSVSARGPLDERPSRSPSPPPQQESSGQAVKEALLAAADALIQAEPMLTELDSRAGDGDLGSSMRRGAEAVRELPPVDFATAATGLAAVAGAVRRSIAGSSGPFYATALMRASRFLAGVSATEPLQWAKAFVAAVDAISDLGGAHPGDRTMIDALAPAAVAFEDGLKHGKPVSAAWVDAVAAAERGAEATRDMSPRLGRASYLGERTKGIPDAGAVAVVCWMRAIGPTIDRQLPTMSGSIVDGILPIQPN